MKKKYLFFIIMLLIFCFLVPVCWGISRYGSSGEEVKEIQKKLKQWGYYDGEIDGIYGSKTFSAVKKFQTKNGLTADGIAGEKTLSALGINNSNSSNSGNNVNNTDLNLLSKLVHGEARGEPYKGMVAVAATVLNRVADSRFPNTIAGVIYQSGAYTCVADGQINLEASSQARKAAQDALNGWDPSGGCIYFYNPATSTSKWIWSRPIVKAIGKHNFAK